MKYSELVLLYEKLDSTSKRLEKTYYIAEALKKAKKEELEMIMLLIRGRVFPDWEKDKKLGFSDNYMIRAVQLVTGETEQGVKKLWAEKGDIGLVAEALGENKKQKTLFSRDLSVEKVFDNIRKLPFIEGPGSVDRKVQTVSELLSSASAKEAKYIARTVLEVLRIGVGIGTIRDAIAWAYLGNGLVEYKPGEKDVSISDREGYKKMVDAVQGAYDKLNDFAKVAFLASQGVSELEKVKIVVEKPLKVMLAQMAENVPEGFEKVGKPALIEYKYDGFRVQIHKKGKKVTVYTRRLEDVTPQFPDIVDSVKHVRGKEFILDGEAMGYDPKTKKYLPFQNISQRIKRKYGIDEMVKDLPVEVNVFDVLYYEGESYIEKPIKERRELIEKIVESEQWSIRPSIAIVTDDEEKAMKFYEESKDKGMEGVMMKNLEAPYKPGSRVGHMIKIKPVMETLDLVIVSAEWGEGKRSGWLTSYTLACVDLDGNFLTIGKVGTGVKELEEAEGVSFNDITEMLKPLVVHESGKELEVKPEVIIEVRFNEIQKSSTYGSGYALRFPRLVRVRDDRGADDCSSIEMVMQLFRGQKS